VAGAAGLAGWHNGKLGEIASAGLTALGKLGVGNFRTPSTFPGGAGVGGVSDFLQSRDTSEWKEELKNALKFAIDARAAYRRYGRTARTVEELEEKVDAFLKRKYGEIEVAGTTNSSGDVVINDDPNPYTKEATRRHEEVHRRTVLGGIERYGRDTPEYNSWFNNPRNWAADEVKAYSAEIKYMRQTLRQLRGRR